MKKVICGLIATMLLICAFGQGSTEICYAATKKSRPVFVEEQAVGNGRSEVSVAEYSDNGKAVYVCSDQVTDKEKVVSMLENRDLDAYTQGLYTVARTGAQSFSISEPTGPDQGWAPVRIYHKSARAANNSNVGTAFSIYAQAYSANVKNFKVRIYGGQTSGTWYGQGNAKKIVLRQSYDFSGVGVSVSWPLSIGLNKKDKSYEWVSSDYTDVWLCTAPHEDITASNWNAAIGVNVADGADVYLGSTCYKARCEISKDWHAVYYNNAENIF